MARGPTIGVNIVAGNAELFAGMRKAGASVEDFANRATRAGSSSRASFIAASASARVLEGRIGGNVLTVSRFLSQTLKLGPVLQAAFPIIGGLSFGVMLAGLYQKVVDFRNSIKYAGETVRGAFQPGISSIQSANDQLRVQLATLNQDIDKLLGRRENGLALALAEAIKFVDELSTKVTATVKELGKLTQEDNIGKFKAWLTGQERTTDIGRFLVGESGSGGVYGGLLQQQTRGRGYVEAAEQTKGTDAQVKAAVDAAVKKADDELAAYIKTSLGWVQQRLETLRKNNPATVPVLVNGQTVPGPFGQPLVQTNPEAKNITNAVTKLESAQAYLSEVLSGIGLSGQTYVATTKKQGLEAGAETFSLTKAYNDRVNLLKAEQDVLDAKLKSVGATEKQTAAEEGRAEALKIVAELNKLASKPGAPKEPIAKGSAQEAKIVGLETTAEATKLETKWQEAMFKSTTASNQRIASLGLLSAALGRGYQATKEATVETEVMAEIEAHATDEQWKRDNAIDIFGIKIQKSAEYEAKYARQLSETLQKNKEAIDAEQLLAKAYLLGSAAVAQANLQIKLRDIGLQNSSYAVIALASQEARLFNLGQLKSYNEQMHSINESYDRAVALLKAQAVGEDAVRQAQLQAKIEEEQSKVSDAAQKATIATEMRRTATVEWLATEMEAARKVEGNYDEEIKLLTQREALLMAENKDWDKNLNTLNQIRNLKLEILQVETKQALATDKAAAGVKAFFLDMQAQALSSSEQINKLVDAALHSTVDDVATELGKLLTGQKTSFGKAFQKTGETLITGTIKTGLEKVLGSIFQDKDAKAKLAAALKDLQRPLGTSADPVWVTLGQGTGGGGGSSQVPGTISVSTTGPPTVSGGPGEASTIASGAGTKLAQTGLAGVIQVLGSLIHFGGGHAEGGFVTPDEAYLVGEHGPEILAGVSGRVMSNSQSRRAISSSSGANLYYSIDARGTDPVLTDARVRASILAAHNNAVQSAVRVNAERMFRVPRGTGRMAGAGAGAGR